MSHHSHDNAHIKQVFKDVLMLAMSHMQNLGKEIQKLNPTEEVLQKADVDYKRKIMQLNNLLNVINDIVHPAFHLIPDLFPGSQDMVELCKKNFKIAIDSGVFPAQCPCYMCKIEKTI
jgi:hypothetical protein